MVSTWLDIDDFDSAYYDCRDASPGTQQMRFANCTVLAQRLDACTTCIRECLLANTLAFANLPFITDARLGPNDCNPLAVGRAVCHRRRTD